MSERDKLIEVVEYFYSEIIEKYKTLEKQVASESKITTLFKKVDYKSRISKLKDLKKKAQNMNLKSIQVNSDNSELKEKLVKCVNLFDSLINSQVAFNMYLNNKSEGKKMEISEYKNIVQTVKLANEAMQRGLKDLDIIYADLEV